MLKTIQLRVSPEVAATESLLRRKVAETLAVTVKAITEVRIRRRSIDARQRMIFVNLTLDVFLYEAPTEPAFEKIAYGNVEHAKSVVVVGAGPGGLFAALRLIELGLRPIVLERGKDVRERKKDIARISREHLVDPESNYSFGEGGAGA